MYKMFMTKENLNFVERAISCLLIEFKQREDPMDFWVCYGSFVLNQQTPESDIDLLYVHNQTGLVKRIQSSFEGHQVTIYSINRNDFIDDGRLRKFGGYFTGKILNPYVVFNGSEKDKLLILDTAIEFIFPFMSGISSKLNKAQWITRSNLIADSVLARLYICPWYHSYFLRYYVNPDFKKIWNHMEEIISSSLVKSGLVIQDGSKYKYSSIFSNRELHTEAIKVSARFWSWGCYLHNSRFDFSDYYIQKSEQFILKNNFFDKLQEMMLFLEGKTKGGNNGTQ